MKFVFLCVLLILIFYFIAITEISLIGAFVVVFIGLIICISLIEFCKWIDKKSTSK